MTPVDSLRGLSDAQLAEILRFSETRGPQRVLAEALCGLHRVTLAEVASELARRRGLKLRRYGDALK